MTIVTLVTIIPLFTVGKITQSETEVEKTADAGPNFSYFTDQEMTLQGNSFQPFFWTKTPGLGGLGHEDKIMAVVQFWIFAKKKQYSKKELQNMEVIPRPF